MLDNPFKGTNEYCKTCKKACKQFENVEVVVCPNRVHIKSQTFGKGAMDKHRDVV